MTGGMCCWIFSWCGRLLLRRREGGNDLDLNFLFPPTLALDDLSDSESGAGASAGVEHSDNEQLDELEPGSSTFNRFNGYIDSDGGAASFNRFAGALGDDRHSYPGVETSEFTLCELDSGISIDCVDVVLTEDVSYSPSEGWRWKGWP